MTVTYWVDHQKWVCRRHVPPARYPAAVEQCLMGCPQSPRPPHRPLDPNAPVEVAPKAAPVVKVVKAVNSEAWKDFDGLNNELLSGQSLGALRKYAANVLKLKGASKIRGGKPALLDRIVQHRGTA